MKRRSLLLLALAAGSGLPPGSARAATSVNYVPTGGSDTSDGVLVLASVTSDNGVYDNYTVPATFDPAVYQEYAFSVSTLPAGAYLTVASVYFNFFEKACQDAVLQVWEQESASWRAVAVDASVSDNKEITVNPSVLSFLDVATDAQAVKVRFLAAKAGNGPLARTDFVQVRYTYDLDTVAPTVTLLAPAPGSFHTTPIHLEASASDAGGAGLRRVIFQYAPAGSGGPWTTITAIAAAPFAHDWTPPADGNYDLRAIAEDYALNQTADGAAGIGFNAAPAFLNLTPAPTTSVPTTSPAIAVDVVDAADGIAPASLKLLVNGADVTAQSTVAPIAGGYRLSYIPTAALAWGSQATVEARATDGRGNPGARAWIFYVHLRYEAGAIVLDTTHTTSTAPQIYDAYGLAERLAGQGIEVDWVIRQDKAYAGVDLTAQVDTNPNGATPGADGPIATRSYAAGAFLVRDPNPATTYNEAWDSIAELVAAYGFAPNFDEVRTPVAASRTDVMFLTYRPKVAAADDGLATGEMDDARIPYTVMASPGTTGNPASLAGGALFFANADPLCGRVRKYDLYIQGHYDWTGPDAAETAAISELDQMIGKAGMAVFQCASATIEQTAHWITDPGSTVVEGTPVSASFDRDPTRLGHPFLQTMEALPIEGGAFAIWSKTGNRFRPNLQNILFDPANGDIGYVFGAVGSGKAYYMGGHQRRVLADRRLMLNAILYNVVYPKFDRRYDPTQVVAGADNLVTVLIHVRGGSISYDNHLEDRLATTSTFVDGSVALVTPDSSYTWDPAAKTLRFDLGDLNPHDYPGGIVGSYQIVVHPPVEGVVKILDHVTTYRDAWGASYRYESTGCADVVATPMLSLDKSASVSSVIAGVTTRMTLRLTVRNHHSSYPVNTVTITDTLPPGVSFVPGSIVTAKGSADWGVSAPATLTWKVGVLVPNEDAVLTFQVDATPAAAGIFRVNDGAAAAAKDASGNPLSGRSNDVDVTALAANQPLLDFDLTPGAVPPYAASSFSFCTRNAGVAKSFKKNADQIVLTVPAEFGRPTGITTPAGWKVVWDGTDRTLTFTYPPADFTWASGTSICFGFSLTAPGPPQPYDFDASGTINGGASSFTETLPVVVNRIAGLSFGPAGSGATEPCGKAVYAHTLRNDSNGSDVFNLSASSSQGYAVSFYRDADGTGTLTAGDPLLADSDRDGLADTGGMLAGDSFPLLVVVVAGNTSVPVSDTTTVTARSAAVPSVFRTLTDTTAVSALLADVKPDLPAVCAGGSITLDAGAGFASYSWSTGATSRTIAVTPPATTTYRVDVTNPSGCATSATEAVTVNPNPSPSILPAAPAVCAGDPVTLDAGAGFATYLWSTGATSRTIAVAPMATTSYGVTVTSAAGCTGAASRTVTVNPRPSPVISPAAPSICEGTSVVLDAGAGFSSYLWSTGATSRTLTVSPSSSTTYSVTVTSPSGCSGTATRTVTVNPAPSPVIAPASPAICAGASVVLDAGPGFAAYLWSTGATTRTVTVAPGATTSYSVSVTAAGGCTGSATRTVTVNPPPAPSISPVATTVCGGNAATLDAGPGFSSYLWSTGATTRTITVTPAATTDYDVTVTSAAGCTGAARTTVTVVDRPVITPPNPEVCAGGSVVLDAGSGFASYLWSTGETTQTITVSPAATTAYDVTVSSAGCSGSAFVTVTVHPLPTADVAPASATICPGASATLTATTGPGDALLWSTGETTPSITVAPTATTAYQVTARNSFGCTAVAGATVTVHPAVVAAISPANPSICEGGSPIVLDAGAGFTSYLWSTGETTRSITVAPAAATDYTVTVTAATGCAGSATTRVAVLASPVITPVNPAICPGGSVTLDAGPGYASYLWSTGETTRTIDVAPAATASFSVTATAGNGCAGTASATVTVRPRPRPVFLDPAPEICDTTGTEIDAGPGFASYLWSTGETTRTILVSPSSDTRYDVTVTDAFGCDGSGGVTVAVHGNPSPAVTASAAAICPGGTATLDAGAGYASYLWSTGATGQAIAVSPAATAAYTVTVTSAEGCPGTGAATVVVNPPPPVDAGAGWVTCPNTPVRLGTVALPGHTYSWQPAAGLDDPASAQPLALPAATTTYTLTVTDAATGCVAGDQVTVTVQGSAPPVALGNVLKETRAANHADVVHHWIEVPSANEYEIYVATAKSMAGAVKLSTVAVGAGIYPEAGAVSDGNPRRFYQVLGTSCVGTREP